MLGHKNIRNTLVYTHLVTFETEDNYVARSTRHRILHVEGTTEPHEKLFKRAQWNAELTDFGAVFWRGC